MNHKIFDPSREDQREDYFYSHLLLFVPFRNESEFVKNEQTAEEAFNHFITTAIACLFITPVSKRC